MTGFPPSRHGAASAPGRPTRLALVLMSCGISCWSIDAVALSPDAPVGYILPRGHHAEPDVTVRTVDNVMTVTHKAPRALIEWDTFNIGPGATLRFDQPNATSVVMNQVVGSSPTLIAGALKANGRVFLINPNGVTFSEKAHVDVAGLVVSALALKSVDFNSHKIDFEGAITGEVINHGTLTAQPKGFIALLGGQIENIGHIVTPQGDAILSAGTAQTVAFGNLPTVSTAKASVPGHVSNLKEIKATGGRIWMTADGERHTNGTVTNKGTLDAAGAGDVNGGLIQLSAKEGDVRVEGWASVSGDRDGGYLLVDGDRVLIDGGLQAMGSSGKGGLIKVSAKTSLELMTQATLAAHGSNGSGEVNIGSTGYAAFNGDVVTGGSIKFQARDLVVSAAPPDPKDKAVSMLRPDLIGRRLDVAAVTLQAHDTLKIAEDIRAPHGLDERPSDDTPHKAAGMLRLQAGTSVEIEGDIVTPRVVAVRAGVPLSAGSVESTGRILMKPGSTVQASTASFQVGAAPDEQGTIQLATVKAEDLIIDLKAEEAPRLARQSKVYDGHIAGEAAIQSFEGGLTFAKGSNLLARPSHIYFEDSQVGSGKPVFAHPSVVGHHGLAEATVRFAGKPFVWNGVGDITARPLTVSAAVHDKVYDGTTEARLRPHGLTLRDVVGHDDVTVSAEVAFAAKDVGPAVAVRVAQPRLAGTDAANYVLADQVEAGVAQILAKPLQVRLRAQDKVYDRDTLAKADFIDDRVPGDRLNIDFDEPARFADSSVGPAKRVTATVNVSGDDSGNYRWDRTQRLAFADITPRPLDWSATAEDKSYDGTRVATVHSAHSGLEGDRVAVHIDEALFEDKQSGRRKVVELTGVRLEGEDSGNYALQPLEVQPKASISPRLLKVSATIRDKDYDSTRYAEIQTLTVNKVEGDDLNVLLPVAFEDKHAGKDKKVVSNAVRLSGDDRDNYDLSEALQPVEVSSATIHPRLITVIATAAAKIYDGKTTAEVTALKSDSLPGDKVRVRPASAEFDDRHAGTGKQVTVGALQLEGDDQDNYRLASPFVITTADITPRPLPVVATVENKVYDGTVSAKVDALHTGALHDDDVAVMPSTARFDDAAVGLDRRVTLGPLSIKGTSASDYMLPEQPLTAIADIHPRTLTVSASARNKIYDGSTQADATVRVTAEEQVVPGDDVDIVFDDARFDDAIAAPGKRVVVSGVRLAGRAAGNYRLPETLIATRADIDPRPLSVVFRPEAHGEDGTVVVQGAATGDPLPDDRVSIRHEIARFDTPWPGLDKLISVTGLSVTGPDAINYALRSNALTVRGGILMPRAVPNAPAWIGVCERSGLCGVTEGEVRPSVEGGIRLPPGARP